MRSMLSRFFVIALGFLFYSASFASADEDDWEFRLTPYGWVPSMQLDGNIAASRDFSSDTDVLDILDFAFLLSGEARKGDLGLIAEFNYLALSDEFQFAGGRVRGNSELKGIIGGFAAAYRIVGDDAANLDAFAGFRIWSLEATADFRVLPTVSRKTTFVDPIIGFRGSYDITDDLFVSGLAEVGGFGVGSDFQWEVIGRLGYRVSDTFAVGAGYRHLALNVDRGGLNIDAAITGPFVAFDINF